MMCSDTMEYQLKLSVYSRVLPSRYKQGWSCPLRILYTQRGIYGIWSLLYICTFPNPHQKKSGYTCRHVRIYTYIYTSIVNYLYESIFTKPRASESRGSPQEARVGNFLNRLSNREDQSGINERYHNIRVVLLCRGRQYTLRLKPHWVRRLLQPGI